MNITLTEAAEKFIRRVLRFGGGYENGFRLSVSPGGCSGLNSEFTVEAAPKQGDATHTVNGIKLFLPAESRLLLDGYTIDFADTPTQSGLVFSHPNGNNCGCSSSSSASAPAGVSTISIGSIVRKH